MDVVAWDDRLKVVMPSTLLHKLHMHTLMSLCLQPQSTGINANSGYSQSWISTYTTPFKHNEHTTETHSWLPQISYTKRQTIAILYRFFVDNLISVYNLPTFWLDALVILRANLSTENLRYLLYSYCNWQWCHYNIIVILYSYYHSRTRYQEISWVHCRVLLRVRSTSNNT